MEKDLLSIKSKLPKTGTTIFAVMSKMAFEYGAINLSQGFPDFPVSPKLIGLVNSYMKKGMNQYAPMEGIIKLREQLAEKVSRDYNAHFDPDLEINITSGATEAIYSAITAMIHEGDEVIVFEPYYDSYVPSILLNGGIPIFIPLEPPSYTINWEAVKNRVSSKTRMIIINTPNNPTGTTLSADDMKELEKIVHEKDIFILSDEVYEHIIFDGIKHQSVLLYPELSQRSFVVFSFGKTFHATGWKVGYCIAPAPLMKEFRRVHQFIVFTTMTSVQYALAEFMEDPDEYEKLPGFYQQKRDYFIKELEGSRFRLKPCEGTYFQSLDYSDITDIPDKQYAEELTKTKGLASIPVSAFYSQGSDHQVLRFCFAKSEDTLKAAAEIIKSI